MSSPGIGRVLMSKNKKVFGDLDPVHRAGVSMPEGHRQVHLGNMFGVSGFFTIPTGGSHNFVMAPSVETHIRISVSVSGNAKFRLLEDVAGLTGLANTGEIINRNRHRVHDAVEVVALSAMPTPQSATGFSTSVELGTAFLPGGTRVQATGSTNTDIDEWVLAAGRIYVIEIENLSGSEMNGSLNIDAYAPARNLLT